MRYFTYDEALQKLPEVEKIIASAQDIRARAQAKLEKLQVVEKSGDAAATAIERGQVEFLAQCLEETLRGIETLGAVLKGLDPALVDFPHRMDGHEVYLCWREGERGITHYHGLEEGFSGRRPLPKKQLPH